MGGARLVRALVIAGAALALLTAVACNDSGSSDETPGSGTAVATVVPAATPTAFSSDMATAVAAKGAVEMVDYTDKDGRYTVKVPRGWGIETNTDVMTAYLIGDPVTATVGVFCLPGADIPGIESFDERALSAVGGGKLPLDSAAQVKVGALDAVQIPWTGGIAGISLERVFVYFTGNGCAWRIQMTVWPGTTIEEMKPVLETMKASFAFKS